MTPKEHANQLRAKIEELKKNNRPFQLAVLSSVAQVSKRVFSDGKNQAGSTFAYNDIEPVYITDEQSPRKLSHKGKFGKSVFASGEKKGLEHTTTYFASYKEFRQSVGRESNFVNWQLNGDLMSDFGSLPRPESKQPPSQSAMKPAKKVNPNEYITALDRTNNVKKYEGLSDRFGKFLELSSKEEAEFYRILEGELALFLAK